jgi:hypothetical protein
MEEELGSIFCESSIKEFADMFYNPWKHQLCHLSVDYLFWLLNNLIPPDHLSVVLCKFSKSGPWGLRFLSVIFRGKHGRCPIIFVELITDLTVLQYHFSHLHEILHPLQSLQFYFATSFPCRFIILFEVNNSGQLC